MRVFAFRSDGDVANEEPGMTTQEKALRMWCEKSAYCAVAWRFECGAMPAAHITRRMN
jgi:hypothetical protein